MTDPLPVPVRCLLEDIAAGKDPFLMDFKGRAEDQLYNYPKPRPERARFHSYAETLRQIASEDYKPDHQSANWLRAIADDIDPTTAPPAPPPRRNPYKAAL